MSKRTTNTTYEKALGRESEGFKKCATNKEDFIPKDAAQLRLDLDDQYAAASASPAARPTRPCLTSKPLLPDKPRSKLETILRLFKMGRNMNRFEAEDHHDHCLHSTVSTLQNDYGIKIARQSETVPCLRGRSSVRCMRYWLDTAPDNIIAARAMLAMLEKRS